jgi:hypothetical protein
LTELRQRLIRVLACALSTYAWLIGAAQLLLGTGPTWLNLTVLAVGTAAMPWWYGALVRDPSG